MAGQPSGESGQSTQQRARVFRDMLLDALHAMYSMDEAEGLESSGPKDKTPDGMLERR